MARFDNKVVLVSGGARGQGAGRGRRGHTPFIIAVETSADGRPLHARHHEAPAG